MVAVELEVLAKKFDRFGWDRDTGTMVHDRMITDWMDALQDYPLVEIQAACRREVIKRAASGRAKDDKMPNEGHIVAQIMIARQARLAGIPRRTEPEILDPLVTKEQAAQIMAEYGFATLRPQPMQSEATTRENINAAKTEIGGGKW